MAMVREPISETDLVVYVDGQLAPERRIAIETALALDPAAAARVMADLRDRDILRLAAGAETLHRPETGEAARRLQSTLRLRRLGTSLRRVAAVGLLLSFGWAANEVAGPIGVRESVASSLPPAFVGDALMAHRTSEIRAGMASQPGVKRLDPAEILAATAITMPVLPARWTIDDVQVFPSPFGPSVETAIQTTEFGRLSLFAVRPGTFDVIAPTITGETDVVAAYWQIGDVAYALVTQSAERGALAEAADRLAATLH
ncbi:transcriptional regulator (anti-sigma factor) [Aureimonas glaciei]|uniref:Transcriptional regulator (Anti-sigma factor) n=2 Tax=Aureimonas glaciei TaxID=1776957 RepID=A0A916Y4S4_9HYPH|nr:transcriptional regulator (anti-sigma factor) [Aureimonas glaciei]